MAASAGTSAQDQERALAYAGETWRWETRIHRHWERRGYVWLELGAGAVLEDLWNSGSDVFFSVAGRLASHFWEQTSLRARLRTAPCGREGAR